MKIIIFIAGLVIGFILAMIGVVATNPLIGNLVVDTNDNDKDILRFEFNIDPNDLLYLKKDMHCFIKIIANKTPQ